MNLKWNWLWKMNVKNKMEQWISRLNLKNGIEKWTWGMDLRDEFWKMRINFENWKWLSRNENGFKNLKRIGAIYLKNEFKKNEKQISQICLNFG